MGKKKVCRSCRYFYEGSECPVCKSNQTATTWQGRVHVLNFEHSEIGKKINVKQAGEYAIKIR